MSGKFELEIVNQETALQVFEKEGGLDPLIAQTKEFVESFQHDMTTATGRKRTASLAHRVAKLKTKLDNTGKDLTKEWKEKAKVVDSTRKKLREELDILKIEARKPLTDWEQAEEARIKAEEEARKAEELKKEVESCHELAILINEKFDREKEEARIAEQKRLEEEKRIAEEKRVANEKRIAEGARIKAEEEAKDRERKLKEEAEKKQLEAQREREESKRREEELRREKVEAEERAKIQAELAEKKRLEDIEKAKKEEAQRIKREEEKKENERLDRERNEKHRKDIMNQSYSSLVNCGVDKETAQKVVELVANNKIQNISIQF